MVNAVLNQDNIEKGRKIIADLVARFNSNKGYFTSNLYKEEEAKVEFINPMFEALGWDVHNKQGLGPNFKEVIFEESLAIGKETRAPDYSFRLGGQLIYYLEAKKPSVNIKEDRSPAYQARRYGWSAKIPIVILTDFEELAIYETTSKPKESERASTDRVLYYTYEEYVEKWDEIYSIFSKEAVLKELFQKFVDDHTSKTKRGTQSIDNEFLKDIEKWRLLLARNIALRNKELTLSELNLAVQLIIDRIVFFRMAEDRGIERYQTLYKLSESENIYQQLCEVFKKADLKYNSGLFHFNVTPDYSEFVDNITLHLNIDDGVFKEIFNDLYYPKSPYEFSVISPEILGNIYENFLGSIIRLTPSHQAKIEQKPEVKKAGGVFYTPQYIADYIVENTVGELIKGKTPNQISKLRILDPACGSGSFLLRAFQKLLDYHLEYYIGLKKPPKEVYYVGKDNVPRLTIKEKKRILTNNIYGVDIDVNAVEVTKLSLLLKVLEDENKDILEQQQKLYQEKVLPNLSYNIKCGNSLIGTDILDHEELEHEEILELNPFNWKHEFPLVFANGGFDAVIGNPPYVRIQNLNGILKESYTSFYKDIISGNYDLYILFVKKGFDLLKNNGKLGYILPNKFFTTDYGHKIREYILEHQCISKIIDFKTNQIFDNATTYTCLLFLSNKEIKEFEYASIELGNDTHNLNSLNYDKIKIDSLNHDSWIFTNETTTKILDKINNFVWTFDNISEKIFKGSSTGNDKVFLFDYVSEDSKYYYVNSKVKNNIKLEKELLKPFINGRDIRKYELPSISKLLLFPYHKQERKMELIPFNELKKDYPFVFDYLIEFRDLLKERKIKMDNKNFYKYSAPRNLNEYEKNKILIPDMIIQSKMTIDSVGNIFHGPAIHSIAFKEEIDINMQMSILGILNSKLFWFFISNTSTALKGNAYRLTPKYLNNFKFPNLNENKNKLNEINRLVRKILTLYQDSANCKVPKEEKLLKIQINKVDEQINARVYELYGLTDDEIDIIENSLKE